jgi:signal transduction histidine kinase/ligand-binding sensor domain-containing protein
VGSRRTAIALVLCGTSAAWALPPAEPPVERTDYSLARWTTAQGLPQNSVTDIQLLPNGELWLATFGGLARFDGERFKVVDIASDEGLPSNRILALAPDESGSFVLLTQQGHLARIEAGRTRTLVPPPAHVTGDVGGLLLSPRHGAFARSDDGRLWHSDGAKPWRELRATQPGAVHMRGFAAVEAGEVWAGWGSALVRLTGSGPHLPVALPAPLTAIASRPGGGTWIGLDGRLGLVTAGRFAPVDVRPALTGVVMAIEPVGPDQLWVAAGDDVSRLDRQVDGTWRRTVLPLGLGPGVLRVRALEATAGGTLWIGTEARGLVRASPTPTRHFGGQGITEATALVSDAHGGAWAASACQGLFHLWPGGAVTRVRLHRAQEPAYGCRFALASEPDGTLWVRAKTRLLRVRHPDGDVQHVTEGLPEDDGPIVFDSAGALWVVSRTGPVQRLSRRGEVQARHHLSAPLVSAAAAPDGSIWIGGEGRVFRLKDGRVEEHGAAALVPRGPVRDVLVDGSGTAWIATYGGGLGRLRGGRVDRVTTEHGLPDNSVSRILEDPSGRVWIATNRGVAVTSRADLDLAAGPQQAPLQPVVLGPERGVAEANFGEPAGFIDVTGGLWVGTIDGVAWIDTRRFPFNRQPPEVRIEAVLIDDRPVPITSRVQVPPTAARVRVNFTSFDLLYAERMRFRYRVEGVDRAWVDAGTRRFGLWTPSDPGVRRFLVQGRNEDGVWATGAAAIEIEVLAAWWQTAPVRASAVLALIAFGLLLYRARVRSIERRHAERVHRLEEQRRADERAASLRAQLERVSRAALAGELAASLAHEVNQPLGAIVNNAETGRRHLRHFLQKPDELRAILNDIVTDGLRASDVVRGLRGFLQAGGREAALVDLNALVREVLPIVRRELSDARVETVLALGDRVPPVRGFRVQLGQVIVNLVMNASEALTLVGSPRRVEIRTALRGGVVEVSITDNGPGFPAEIADRVFEPFVTTKAEGMGMGLAICRSIAEAHGGRLWAETPEPGGLRVVLSLPASPLEQA